MNDWPVLIPEISINFENVYSYHRIQAYKSRWKVRKFFSSSHVFSTTERTDCQSTKYGDFKICSLSVLVLYNTHGLEKPDKRRSNCETTYWGNKIVSGPCAEPSKLVARWLTKYIQLPDHSERNLLLLLVLLKLRPLYQVFSYLPFVLEYPNSNQNSKLYALGKLSIHVYIAYTCFYF